jgi:protein SCO1/2
MEVDMSKESMVPSDRPSSVTRRRALAASARVAVAACMASGAAALLASCGEKPKAGFHSIDVTGATFGQGFALTDFNGQPRTLDDYKGKVVALFFGFTQCPDACPTALLKLAEVKKALGPDADRLQVVFITVDPERDTPELLKNYVPAFDPAFTGLYGTPQQIAEVAKSYKAYYSKVKGATPTSYTIDHSTFTYLYDPQGRLRLMARHEIEAKDLAADIRALMKG